MARQYERMYMYRVFWFENREEHGALFTYREDAQKFVDEHPGAILNRYSWEVQIEK